jgi:hypothetical protein
MKQVLHIFQKDVRRYWRESAISVALVAAFAWNEMRGWAHENDLLFGTGVFFSSRFLPGLLVVLVPISWWFVIVRVIQGESLVGDRQFWITRPYEWKKLLAAKVIFVLAFVSVPLLTADVVLLAKAGFPPTSHLSGLTWMQLLIALFFILPIAALATVTASVLQIGLALLAIALYIVGMAALSSQIPSSGFSGPADSLTATLLIGTSLAVILWQYARRKTAVSRLLIIGLAAAIFVILVATPYRTIVAREYPKLAAGQQPPLKMVLLPSTAQAARDNFDKDEKEVEIRLPLGVSGMADESIVVVSGVMLAVETPEGLRWNSGWESPGIFLFPSQRSTQISFKIKKDFFERAKSSSVNGRISLALTLFRDRDRREFVTPHGEFAMPEVGLCSAEWVFYQRIHCRAPLRGPSFLLMTTDMSATTCPLRDGESPANPGEIARGWSQNGDSDPAEFGISPVKTLDLYVSDQASSTKRRSAGICPGTPLILSHPELVQRTQIELEFSRLHLPDYRYSYGPLMFGSMVIPK